MPRKSAMGAVRRGVEADLIEVARAGEPSASAGLQEVARVLAAVLDGDAPATAKVQASKTFDGCTVRLARFSICGEWSR